MRTLITLFDAPVPARAAARALVAAGFSPADMMLLPPLPDAPTADPPVDLPPGDPVRLARGLVDRGVMPQDAALFAEGLRRGAILLVVGVPTLSVPIAGEVIASVLPPDPAALAGAWAADLDLRYRWAELDPPILLDPATAVTHITANSLDPTASAAPIEVDSLAPTAASAPIAADPLDAAPANPLPPSD